jgi:hypothetical protein
MTVEGDGPTECQRDGALAGNLIRVIECMGVKNSRLLVAAGRDVGWDEAMLNGVKNCAHRFQLRRPWFRHKQTELSADHSGRSHHGGEYLLAPVTVQFRRS